MHQVQLTQEHSRSTPLGLLIPLGSHRPLEADFGACVSNFPTKVNGLLDGAVEPTHCGIRIAVLEVVVADCQEQ